MEWKVQGGREDGIRVGSCVDVDVEIDDEVKLGALKAGAAVAFDRSEVRVARAFCLDD